MPTTVHISGGFGFVYMLHFASCVPDIGRYQEYKLGTEKFGSWFDPPITVKDGKMSCAERTGCGDQRRGRPSQWREGGVGNPAQTKTIQLVSRPATSAANPSFRRKPESRHLLRANCTGFDSTPQASSFRRKPESSNSDEATLRLHSRQQAQRNCTWA